MCETDPMCAGKGHLKRFEAFHWHPDGAYTSGLAMCQHPEGVMHRKPAIVLDCAAQSGDPRVKCRMSAWLHDGDLTDAQVAVKAHKAGWTLKGFDGPTKGTRCPEHVGITRHPKGIVLKVSR